MQTELTFVYIIIIHAILLQTITAKIYRFDHRHRAVSLRQMSPAGWHCLSL